MSDQAVAEQLTPEQLDALEEMSYGAVTVTGKLLRQLIHGARLLRQQAEREPQAADGATPRAHCEPAQGSESQAVAPARR